MRGDPMFLIRRDMHGATRCVRDIRESLYRFFGDLVPAIDAVGKVGGEDGWIADFKRCPLVFGQAHLARELGKRENIRRHIYARVGRVHQRIMKRVVPIVRLRAKRDTFEIVKIGQYTRQ